MSSLLTVKQVAEQLNCSEGFVYCLLSSGRLAHHTLGEGQGAKRVSELQLNEYLRRTARRCEEKEASPPARS